MNKIKVDVNLMDNYMPSGLLPGVQRFEALYGPVNKPMMIYQDSKDQQLKLIHHNELSGQTSEIKALLPQADFPTSTTLVDFAVSQDGDTHMVFIAMYWQGQSSGRTINLVRSIGPISPSQLIKGSGQLYQRSLGSWLDDNHSKIHIGPLMGGGSMPCVAVSHMVKNDSKIKMFMDDQIYSAKLDDRSDHPDMPDTTIIDIRCAMAQGKHGIWALSDHVKDQDHHLDLGFWTAENGTLSRIQARIPAGVASEATRLAIIQNSASKDELLLVGGGLHHYAADKLFGLPVKVSNEAALTSCTHCFTTQHGSDICLWTETPLSLGPSNKSSTMSYIKMSLTDLTKGKVSATPIPLTDQYQSGKISALPTSHQNASQDQIFMYMSLNNEIRVVSQSATNGLWATSSSFFSLPDVTKLLPLQTYTSVIYFAELGKIDELRTLKLASSERVEAYINGEKRVFGGKDTTPLELTISGSDALDVMQETTDLTASAFTVTDTASRASVTVNAADQTMQRLGSAIKASGDDPQTISAFLRQMGAQGDVDTAAEHLHMLVKRGNEISHPQHTVIVMGLWDSMKAAWHWVEQKGMDVIKIVKNVAGAIEKIAVDIGDAFQKGLHLLIDGWHAIGRVANIVLKAVGLGWQKIKEFLGRAFDWAGIMSATRNIHDAFKSARDRAKEVIDAVADTVISRSDGFLDQIKSNMDSKFDALKAQEQQARAEQKDKFDKLKDPASAAKHEFNSSAKLSVFTSAFKKDHDKSDQGVPNSQGMPSALQTSLDKITSKLDEKDSSGIMTQLKTILKDFAQSVKDGSVSELLITTVKAVLDLILLASKSVVHGILTFAKDMLDDLLKFMDDPIEVPIITPLLRWISGSKDGWALPSPLMIVSFLCAVVQVEMNAFHMFGDRGIPKKEDYDPSKHFPPKDFITSTIIKGHSNNHGNNIANYAYVGDAQIMSPKEAWEGYVKTSACMHPIILGSHFFISTFYNIRKATEVFPTANMTDKQAGRRAGILDSIELVLGIVEIAFTAPPFEPRPGITLNYVSYGLSGVAWVVSLVSKIHKSLLGSKDVKANMKVDLGFSVVQFVIQAGRIVTSLIALAEQGADTGDWTDTEQKDATMIKLSISSVSFQAFAALGRLASDVGIFMIEEDPSPQTFVIGIVLMGAGGISNTVGALVDWGCDSGKSMLELKNSKKAYYANCRK